MREVWVSDDVTARDLTPERCAAARAVLRWSPEHLAGMVKAETGHAVTVAEITGFEVYGEAMAHLAKGAVVAVLRRRVEFTTTEGEPGVVCKREVFAAQGPGYLEFGGVRKRRPPL
jgi:hypothetical protein